MSSMPVYQNPDGLGAIQGLPNKKTNVFFFSFFLLLYLKTIFLHSRDDRCVLSCQGT